MSSKLFLFNCETGKESDALGGGGGVDPKPRSFGSVPYRRLIILCEIIIIFV